MRTLHKPTRILITLIALAMLSLAAFAGTDPSNVGVSDQKAGAILVFPYYVHKAGAGMVAEKNTRISITNVGAKLVDVHILLMDKTCQQLDYYDCITPNGSLIDKASNFDMENSGYMIVLQVDPATGAPIDPTTITTDTPGSLIGNAFVRDGDYVGNYGAEAFGWNTEITKVVVGTGTHVDTAVISLKAPCEFAVEIQNPADALQRMVIAGLVGDINDQSDPKTAIRGAAQEGTGQAFNEVERSISIQRLITASCFGDVTLDVGSPSRTVTAIKSLFTSGSTKLSGYLRFSIGGGVGLLMTSTQKPLAGGAADWSGIRTLHKTKVRDVELTIPYFMPSPVCGKN